MSGNPPLWPLWNVAEICHQSGRPKCGRPEVSPSFTWAIQAPKTWECCCGVPRRLPAPQTHPCSPLHLGHLILSRQLVPPAVHSLPETARLVHAGLSRDSLRPTCLVLEQTWVLCSSHTAGFPAQSISTACRPSHQPPWVCFLLYSKYKRAVPVLIIQYLCHPSVVT